MFLSTLDCFRAPPGRYEQEPPSRPTAKTQKPSGGGGAASGYGEYDYLYKNSPVSSQNLTIKCSLLIKVFYYK